ncbi:MAG: LlaJI family restriction endonuclease [Chitinispirillales bacterium]|jgi:hypothetical protein|nr:LlaJI family restriction endonuclease [Chitinispirillales bacterium]
MADVSINTRNHTGRDKDDFVGMKLDPKDGVKSPSVEAIFPLGYHPDGDIKKELYALLHTIRRHSENKDGDLGKTTAHPEKRVFPFDAYFAVIRDFMQYGYYIEREVKYKRAPLGKINWKRTIAQVRPIIQDSSPIYTDFVIRQNAKKTDNLISLIHEWCVDEAVKTFGWYFTASTFDPRKPTLKIDKDKNYFISVIRDSLKSTFIDRNRALFRAMIAMLRYGGVDGKETFFEGTTHFQTVWESLINTLYGDRDKKKDFFPGTEWYFCGGSEPVSANKLRPDTIMLYGGNLFVLDAKYYSFINDGEHVPAASDINKQVAYGKYAEQKINHGKTENQKKAIVYNAFLIPYDFNYERYELKDSLKEYPYIYIGYARFIREKAPIGELSPEQSYELVLGILIDTKWLMENAEKVDNETGLAEFIEKSYEKAEKDNKGR